MNEILDIKKAELKSQDTLIRFEAVAYFLSHTHPEVRDLLIECHRCEKVRHIKMALNKAINKLSTVSPENIEIENVVEEVDKDLPMYIKNQAIDEVSGLFLHELSPQIGLLKSCLESEFEGYHSSQSKKYIEQIILVFEAIKSLRRSTNRPNNTEIDLAQLLKDICTILTANKDNFTSINSIEIIFEGSSPFILNSDASLLNLAISNALRNGIESLNSFKTVQDEQLKITIRWGKTDKDFWITIQDNGTGVKGNPKEAFKIGNTNKEGHSGFGMAIMQQAMVNLGGYAELSDLSSGGAELLLRWGNL